jgi:hypothetical protein
MVKWIKSYLENGIQTAFFPSSTSSEKKERGVPQGSILGQLLFLKYVLEIKEFVTTYISLALN